MTAQPARATLIDGKAFAAGLVDRVAAATTRLIADRGVKPGLAVVIVGEDPASQVYVRNKGERTLAAGMRSDTHRLPDTTTEAELLALVATLNADTGLHGILVQLPLPAHIDTAAVLDAIDPDKDVDGFHVVNAGRLAVGLPGLVPCTPLGCLMLLKNALGDLSGRNAVIVGRPAGPGPHSRHSGRRRRAARDDPRRLDSSRRDGHRRRYQPPAVARPAQGRGGQDPAGG